MALLTYSVWDTPTFAAQAVRDPVDDLVLANLGQQTGIVTPTTGVVAPGTGYTLNIAAHTISYKGTEQAVTAVTGSAPAAQSTSDRKDLVQVSSTGTVSIVTGTPCGYTPGNWFEGCGFAAPVTPRPTGTAQPLASVYVQGTYTTVTTFTTGMITDKSGVWISPTSTTQGTADITAYQPGQLAVQTSALPLGGQRITGLAAPQTDTDAAQALGTQIALNYFLGSSYLKTIGSTTFAAIDTTNLTISFTALSTQVLLEVEAVFGFFGTPAAGSAVGITFFTHSTTTQVAPQTQIFSAAAATANIGFRCRAYLLATGLTAGTPYHWDLAWAASANTADVGSSAGSGSTYAAGTGPIIIRAFAQ